MTDAASHAAHPIVLPDDDEALDLYTERLMAFCREVAVPRRLDRPDASAHLRSRMCGSTVTIDVALDEGERVSDLGFDVHACSLGSAAAAIVARHAVGSDAATVAAVRNAVRAILDGASEIAVPAGWEDIAVLAPARDTRSRHSAIMIAFDAANEAVKRAVRKRAGAE